MLETKVEQKLRQEVEKIGGKAYKLESPGNNGMPDRLVCLPGNKIMFVETKKPKGGRLSKIQKHRLNELESLGCITRVLNTYELIEAFMIEVKNGI